MAVHMVYRSTLVYHNTVGIDSALSGILAVSYTHLDVYKRQGEAGSAARDFPFWKVFGSRGWLIRGGKRTVMKRICVQAILIPGGKVQRTL